MADVERPKSSRRRRWEVKSQEPFAPALAISVDSPNKGPYYKERPKSTYSSKNKKMVKNKWQEMSHEDVNDNASAKLSALLEDAKDSPKYGLDNPSKLRVSDENLINSELKDYFEENQNGLNPSAPPLSPVKGNKIQKKKVPISVKVTPVHTGVNIINSKITDQLKQLSEDVVDGKFKNNETIPAVAVSGLLIGPSSSSTFNGNVSTIYCERLNNFVMTNESSFLRYQNKPSQEAINKQTRKSHALFLQSGFRTFSVLCQGLLAGLTLAHCLMIFLLQDGSDILLLKNGLEHTFYTIIFILSTVCLISAFDRCDLAGQGMFSEHGIRIPWTPLFYCISLTLSLVSIKAEDFITHYESEIFHNNKENVMYWWKYMCLSRTVFAVLAWIAIVTDPHTDALNSRISELSDE